MIWWKEFANIKLFKTIRFIKGADGLVVEKNDGSLSRITLAELRSLDVSERLIGAGAAKALVADDSDRIILLDTAAGSTITLPAATGSGARYKFLVSVTPTSNQHRINVVGNDAFFGTAFMANDVDNSVSAFEAGADADQINLNGSTTGGKKGDVVELVDMATDSWHVLASLAGTGTEATPFATGQVS